MSTDRSPITTIVDAEVEGAVVDVRIDAGHVTAVDRDLPRAGTEVVDAGGGALIPGLHDHHLHLLAMAAADRSVDVGSAADPASFDHAIRAAAGWRTGQAADAWLRVVGYDDHHGPLDRRRLDTLAPGRKVRVQHRSGAAWVVNSPGLGAIGEESADGWLHRADHDLGRRWAGDGPPDLAPIGRRLAAFGVTGVTDATPFDDGGGFDLVAAARACGDLPQRVMVMGGPALAEAAVPDGLERGPVKVIVADDRLPTPDQLVDALQRAHRASRPVAVHCVTRIGLVLALTAWYRAGAIAGDRIEHGSVIPVELIAEIAELGLQVVTQPAFVWDRGDRYLAEVEPDDQPHLYRCGTLIDARIGVGASTDAPFGPADPWLAMHAAVQRQTRTGQSVGPDEAVPPRRALDLFLAPLARPTAAARTVAVGAAADLCLLVAPLAQALTAPSSEQVRSTWIAGQLLS